MGAKTGIEWTTSTWNPVTGCTKVSRGCDHCYAETLAERFRGTPDHYYENGFDVQLRPAKLATPLRWTAGRRIFVNSMSDLFHNEVPDEYVARVFAVMGLATQHTFQLLTKRHGRMRSLLNNHAFQSRVQDAAWRIVVGEDPDVAPHLGRGRAHPLPWPLPNLWLGVSVEDQSAANLRIPALLTTPAAIRFLSCEPLLGEVDLEGIVLPATTKQYNPDRWDPTEEDFPGVYNALNDQWWPAVGNADEEWRNRHEERMGAKIDWIIAGGESGPGARPMHPGWVRSLRDQCERGEVAFHFKQWGDWTPVLSSDEFQSGREPDAWVSKYDGRVLSEEEAMRDLRAHYSGVYKVGKKAAGRILDGRTHDEFPEENHG